MKRVCKHNMNGCKSGGILEDHIRGLGEGGIGLVQRGRDGEGGETRAGPTQCGMVSELVTGHPSGTRVTPMVA